MDALTINLILHCAGTVLFLTLAILLIHQEKRRMINGFLLELSLYHGVLAMMYAGFATSSTVGLVVGYTVNYLIMFSLIGATLTLLIDGVLVIRREGLSLTHVQPIAWSVVSFLGCCAWYVYCFTGISGSEMQVTLLVFMMNLVLYVPLALGGFWLYSVAYRYMKKPMDCPYVVVLGCAIRKDGTVTPLLRGRLDAAIRWYEQGGKKAKFIVSGGQGKHEVTSEAEAMKKYLLSQNIPEEDIIEENRSTNTRENLQFSVKLMESEHSKFMIATSDYHVLRAVLLARELGMDAQGIGGKTAKYYVPAASLREYLALVMRHKPVMVLYLMYVIMVSIGSMFL